MSTTDKAVQTFAKSLQGINDARADSIASVRNLQAASRVALQVEVSRLAARYGPEDPRTLRMKARVESTAANARALELVADRLAVGVAVPAGGEAILEGRVTDEFGRGVALAAVALADQKGNRIRLVEPAATGKAGYFALRIAEDLLKRVLESNQDGMFPMVLDQAGKSIHIEDRAVKPEPGKVTSLAIALRRTAAPPKGKSTAQPETGDLKGRKPKQE